MKRYIFLAKCFVLAPKKPCAVCGCKLKSMVYMHKGEYVCESCFTKLHEGHLSETEFYALLAKEANNV